MSCEANEKKGGISVGGAGDQRGWTHLTHGHTRHLNIVEQEQGKKGSAIRSARSFERAEEEEEGRRQRTTRLRTFFLFVKFLSFLSACSSALSLAGDRVRESAAARAAPPSSSHRGWRAVNGGEKEERNALL
jgi:hypothetical protein